MNLKHIFLGLVAATSINSLQAQDVLYKTNGGMEEVKITEVGPKTIKYKRWNNQNGPDFIITKNEVEKIQYDNGDEEEYGHRQRMGPHGRQPMRERSVANVNYGRNVIAVAPIFMTNTSATGVGLSYERIIDKTGMLSIYLPAAYSFRTNPYYNSYNNGSYDNNKHMFWFYPGVKVYPTTAFGKVRYGIGAALVFGAGSETYNQQRYDPVTGNYSYYPQTNNTFVMGAMLNNSLNINPTAHIYIGLELGIGIPYYVNNSTSYNSYSVGYDMFDGEPLVQFNFRIGYRF